MEGSGRIEDNVDLISVSIQIPDLPVGSEGGTEKEGSHLRKIRRGMELGDWDPLGIRYYHQLFSGIHKDLKEEKEGDPGGLNGSPFGEVNNREGINTPLIISSRK